MYLDKLILSETSIVVLVETLKHLASALNRLLLSEPLLVMVMVMVMMVMVMMGMMVMVMMVMVMVMMVSPPPQ